MSKHLRSKSCQNVREIYLSSVLQDNRSLEIALAKLIDIIDSPTSKSLLGRALMFKSIHSDYSEYDSFGHIFRQLDQKSFDYQESQPELEYKKRLEALLEFLKYECTRMCPKAFYTVIERVIDEFRPAIFLSLYHPCLGKILNDLSLYLKTDTCHIHLLALIMELKWWLDKNFDEEVIARKIRKFFIPLYGILSLEESWEPEALKGIENILNDERVEYLLKKYSCDRDEIPMAISDQMIPNLLEFDQNISFFSEGSIKSDRSSKSLKLPHLKENSISKYKELAFRRCASCEDLKISSQEKIQNNLFSVLASSSWNSNNFSENPYVSDIYIAITPPSRASTTSIFPSESSSYHPMINILHSIQGNSVQEEEELMKLEHPFASDINEIVSLESITPIPREWVTLLESSDRKIICKVLSSKGLVLILAFLSLPVPYKEVLAVLQQPKNTQKGAIRDLTVLDVSSYYDIVSFNLMPYGGIAEREFICRRMAIKDYPTKKSHIFVMKNIDDFENPDSKLAKGKLLMSGTILRPAINGGCTISHVHKSQLGGIIPKPLLYKYYLELISQVLSDIENSV
ncbi:unnamed protein product [Blepharisma stoltei]|uniref:START domain-containing protein n=1 Tax=Blepharisma stoltei TaxID=1481888 RepID=A0AAU9J0D0_9CILI|nr:unnamed protein product [Blepharisma stoltei]